MEKHYIYKLTSPSGKSYVGRTNDFTSRMHKHKSDAAIGKERKLYTAIRKYGWDNFKKEIIAEVEGDHSATIMELYYITEYNTFHEGYNCTLNTSDGGDVWKGKRDTKQYKEFLKRMSDLGKGTKNNNYGKKATPETKAKQRKAAKGRFTLPWFQDKYGQEEGLAKYEERRNFLKNRKINKDANGKFIPS